VLTPRDRQYLRLAGRGTPDPSLDEIFEANRKAAYYTTTGLGIDAARGLVLDRYITEYEKASGSILPRSLDQQELGKRLAENEVAAETGQPLVPVSLEDRFKEWSRDLRSKGVGADLPDYAAYEAERNAAMKELEDWRDQVNQRAGTTLTGMAAEVVGTFQGDPVTWASMFLGGPTGLAGRGLAAGARAVARAAGFQGVAGAAATVGQYALANPQRVEMGLQPLSYWEGAAMGFAGGAALGGAAAVAARTARFAGEKVVGRRLGRTLNEGAAAVDELAEEISRQSGKTKEEAMQMIRKSAGQMQEADKAAADLRAPKETPAETAVTTPPGTKGAKDVWDVQRLSDMFADSPLDAAGKREAAQVALAKAVDDAAQAGKQVVVFDGAGKQITDKLTPEQMLTVLEKNGRLEVVGRESGKVYAPPEESTGTQKQAQDLFDGLQQAVGAETAADRRVGDAAIRLVDDAGKERVFAGKTKEDAVNAAANALGLTPDDVLLRIAKGGQEGFITESGKFVDAKTGAGLEKGGGDGTPREVEQVGKSVADEVAAGIDARAQYLNDQLEKMSKMDDDLDAQVQTLVEVAAQRLNEATQTAKRILVTNADGTQTSLARIAKDVEDDAAFNKVVQECLLGGGGTAGATPEQTAAVAEPAAAAEPPTPVEEPVPLPEGVEYDISDFTKVGPKTEGTLPGGIYVDKNGEKWQLKKPQTDDHARNEVLTAKLYELAGVEMPEMALVNGPDGLMVGSRWIDDLQQDKAALTTKGSSANTHAHRGFGADAWLANWDVVGLVYDNLKTKLSGVFRTDTGGGLLYRAQGAPKGAAFGPKVDELNTMRNPDINPEAASVFGHIEPEVMQKSVARITEIGDDAIIEAVEQYGPGDAATRKQLADTLIARRDDMQQWLSLQQQPWHPEDSPAAPSGAVGEPTAGTLPGKGPMTEFFSAKYPELNYLSGEDSSLFMDKFGFDFDQIIVSQAKEDFSANPEITVKDGYVVATDDYHEMIFSDLQDMGFSGEAALAIKQAQMHALQELADTGQLDALSLSETTASASSTPPTTSWDYTAQQTQLYDDDAVPHIVTGPKTKENVTKYQDSSYQLNYALGKNDPDPKWKSIVKKFDAVFAKQKPLTKDIVVWRGMSESKAAEFLAASPKATQAGEFFKKTTYVSTSYSKIKAAEFANWDYDAATDKFSKYSPTDKSMMLEILVPAGHKVVYAKGVNPGHTHSAELEVILKRGGWFRSHGVGNDGVLRLEYLGGKKPKGI
jgi:hypothetical protein